MNNTTSERLDIAELCQSNRLNSELVIEIVRLGIIEQNSTDPQDWSFNSHMVTIIHKAVRLHRDLDLDWQGVAVALSLIEEVERLKVENQRLSQRLGRFLAEN